MRIIHGFMVIFVSNYFKFIYVFEDRKKRKTNNETML